MLSVFSVLTDPILRTTLSFFEKNNKIHLEDKSSEDENEISIDAKSSNLQCLFFITKSKKISEKLYKNQEDIYSDIVDKLISLYYNLKKEHKKYYHVIQNRILTKINFTFEETIYLDFCQRKTIKKIIMLNSYNAGTQLILKELVNETSIKNKQILFALIKLTLKIFNILYPEMLFLKTVLNQIGLKRKKIILRTKQIKVIYDPKISKYTYYTKYQDGLSKRAKYLIVSDFINQKQLLKGNISNTLQSLDAVVNFYIIKISTFSIKPLHDGYIIKKKNKTEFLANCYKALTIVAKKNYILPLIKQLRINQHIKKLPRKVLKLFIIMIYKY